MIIKIYQVHVMIIIHTWTSWYGREETDHECPGCYFNGGLYPGGPTEELRKLHDKICTWKDDSGSSVEDRCEGSKTRDRKISKEVIIVIAVIGDENPCEQRRDPSVRCQERRVDGAW